MQDIKNETTLNIYNKSINNNSNQTKYLSNYNKTNNSNIINTKISDNIKITEDKTIKKESSLKENNIQKRDLAKSVIVDVEDINKNNISIEKQTSMTQDSKSDNTNNNNNVNDNKKR